MAKHVTDFTKGLADLVEDTLKIFERLRMPIAPLSKAAWGSKYKCQCFLRWWGVLSLTLSNLVVFESPGPGPLVLWALGPLVHWSFRSLLTLVP